MELFVIPKTNFFIFITFLYARILQPSHANLPPFFYPCNYQGSLDPIPQENDDIVLSVSLEGDPEFYTPETVYQVTITSSTSFNGILVTGLFSSESMKQNIHPLSMGMAGADVTRDESAEFDFTCGRVYSDISPYNAPTESITFLWTAPPVNTGCLSFLVTGSLGMQIAFQDVLAYQLCEEGQIVTELRPSLADVHTDGVILRDDFDSEESVNVWSNESVGVSFYDDCGEISHGVSAVFCGKSPVRQLISVPLNMTAASVVQFTTGIGSCNSENVSMSVSYLHNGAWVPIKRLSVNHANDVHIIQLPAAAKVDGVSLKFSQIMDAKNVGCWAMDNVLVTESENYPTYLSEDMDPIDTSKWLFMPGANIKTDCMSHRNAMVFYSSVNETGPNYAVTRDLDLSAGSLIGYPPSDFVVTNGELSSSACNHPATNTSLYVFNGNGRRKICTTAADSLRNVDAVRFSLSMGSGDCQYTGGHSSRVKLYGIFGSHEKTLTAFYREGHKNAKQVTIPIPNALKRNGAILCLQQMGNYAQSENVWAIDSFELLGRTLQPEYFVQFSLNTLCSATYTETTIKVEYSNDFGRRWHLLQRECLPETCQGRHWTHHSIFKSMYHEGWVRVNLPLPAPALTKHTRVRWIHDGALDPDASWAIDNIYIGSKSPCPNMCNGRGICLPDGCKCDIGWHGFFCNVSTNTFPSSLSADFSATESMDYVFESAFGVHVGYECGMIGSGKALVFDGLGRRYVATKPHNGSEIRYLQFAMLMGRHSTTGSCKPPKIPGDGVLVQYSINKGMTWQLLKLIPYNSERRVNIVSITIPKRASVPGLQIRWLQPNNHQKGEAVWAIDDVILSQDLYKSIYSTPENFEKIYTTSVSFHTGLLTDYCGRINALLFSPQPLQFSHTLRYAETQTVETFEGLVLEADVNLRCNASLKLSSEYDQYHELYLQYSKDEGVTWHLVQEERLPGSTNEGRFHAASIYHVSEFTGWTIVVIPMPRETWSSNLRLRVVQNERSQGVWALDNVYMGPACPMHCRNRGRCRNGVCQCNKDSVGPSCLSLTQLPYGVNDGFSDLKPLEDKNWKIVGGDVMTKDNTGCGMMPSTNFLLFRKPGVRKLETPDLDTSYGGRIQFYIRINGLACEAPIERSNGILLQYSNNGGVTWELLNELYYLDYATPRYIHRDLPDGARTKQTKFRWWQPRNRGENKDSWSIADVIVGEPLSFPAEDPVNEIMLKSNSRRSADGFLGAPAQTFIVFSNKGNPQDFCDSYSNSYVFDQLRGNRFASTDDFSMAPGDVIQFVINIGCTDVFSWNSPVRLEFSHDEGYSWDLVVRACYPDGRPESYMSKIRSADDPLSAYDCTGADRELLEPSVYYQGDYSVWRRIVIPISRRIAARRVRFRWWQHVPSNTSSSTPATWSIRSVHIGPSCPSHCSGHGTCGSGLDAQVTCDCDDGFSGKRCDVNASPVTGFWEHFVKSPNPLWWKTVIGVVGDGCGNVHDDQSLHFGGEGSRTLETVSLKTRSIRMIQFYLKIGGRSTEDSCTIPENRDESVLLQYSNDNGITWNLIKELMFDAYSHRGERVIVDIPFLAKTEYTSFRWWQPQREPGHDRSQWSIDDVYIGGPDILKDGFSDDFNSGTLSEEHWYSVREAHIGQFTKENRTLDPHGYALVVASGDVGYAETWDFRLGAGSFVQFDVALGCGHKNPPESNLKLEYSDDLGITWQPVIPSCSPVSSGCEYDFGSIFYADLHKDWIRRVIALPERLTSSAHVRFRWIYHHSVNGSWAIDNVYIGNGCPWMCNGKGRCARNGEQIDSCTCDDGFKETSDCLPESELPQELVETFDTPWNGEKFAKIIGGAVHGPSAGIVVNGGYLRMSLRGTRLIETIPLNSIDTKYLQFHVSLEAQNSNSALIVQASRNGGITWSTIRIVYSSDLDESTNFIHVELTRYARHGVVSFRIWQTPLETTSPTFKDESDIWKIDNLYIGGTVSGCNDFVLEDNFTSISSTWLHHTHLNSNYFCGSAGTSILSSPQTGEHSATTKDLCISENYVVQFKIAVGCSSAGSDDHAVRLEYSSDHGVSWSLLRHNCRGQNSVPTGCSDEFHPPSIYYPGTTDGWRRITIPLKNIACGPIRFRWYQNYFGDEVEASKSVRWALDDVYIGPNCEQACNGHGACTHEGEVCVCDAGYGGPTCCDIVSNNPSFFQETFDNEDGHGKQKALEQFDILSGGKFHKDVLACDEKNEYQWNYKVDGEGERVIETRDLDLRNGEFLQFYVTFHNHSHSTSGENDETENVQYQETALFLHVQFSTDGGIAWKVIESLPMIEVHFHEMKYIALDLPEESRTNASRIRWWQPKSSSKEKYWFTIDQIFIGGTAKAIDDKFASVDYSTWVEMSGAVIRPEIGSQCCNASSSEDGEKCNILEVGNGNRDKRHCDQNFVTTNGVKVLRGSYLSFDLNMNCKAKSGHCEAIELQYSTDYGKSWDILLPPCYPANERCTRFHQGSAFASDVYPSFGKDNMNSRIVVPIPSHAWSPATRFRWLQTSQFPGAWSLDNVYIGNECPGACLGRGHCQDRNCKCDEGWTGMMCQDIVGTLPTEIKEVFIPESGPDVSKMFSKVVGGQIDDVCGEVGFGHSLRFSKSCSRLLQTVSMDTSGADFVQFMFRTGCAGTVPSQRNEGVLVDFTTNGGAVWHNLAELYYKNHATKPSFINIALPKKAKAVGTQFRWWQPQHSGRVDDDDWALDNLFIGGKREEMMLSDDFNIKTTIGPAGLWLDRSEKQMWQFYDNAGPDSFCGRDNVILGGKVPGLDVTVATKDFFPVEGFIMQYTIVVLCENVQRNHQPVHVQYSVDYGDTWHYLVRQCTPSDRHCFGKEITQPTAHFISPDWRRKTVWIPKFLQERPVRFRFHQEKSDVLWALDRIFIGPACPDACSGHGDCLGIAREDLFKPGELTYSTTCVCDLGFREPNCYLDTDGNKKFLKDDFNAMGSIGTWFIVEPTKTNIQCGVVFDGNSMSFSGVGPRQTETTDLDLRDATFAQHYAVIGSNGSDCLPAKDRKEGVLMQYSVDAGITWHALKELDYQSYSNSTRDYVTLPLEARTNATRLRWWQPFEINKKTGLASMGYDRASWALDNIFIGGNEVNEFSLSEDFEIGSNAQNLTIEGALDERKYDFYPNGRVGKGRCPGDTTYHMMWPGATALYPKQSLTTRQLIVMPGHMVQFKIRVGCTEVSTCSAEFPVRLEYREDPRYDDRWYLVKPVCYPTSVPSPFCIPYFYHDSSSYNLEYQNVWKRITIPLDYISSDLVQFRWIQDDNAPELFSWAIDELYIGESCPNYCSGHGRCTKSLECICDAGFGGEDCSIPRARHLVPVFRDAFETETLNNKLWSKLSGGNITLGGCGPFRYYGFSRTVYFSECGERQLVSREMDLTKAWNIHYALQFGSNVPNDDCQIYRGGLDDGTIMSTIVLQYTTNNGITWHTLREHWPGQYSVPRRVSQPLPSLAKTRTTIFRWWQPSHHGEGYDQWALDNVDISMTRRQIYNHFLEYQKMLAQHRRQSPQVQRQFSPAGIIKSVPKPDFHRNSYRERLPPEE